MGFTRIEKSGGAIRVIESDSDGVELSSSIIPSFNEMTGKDVSTKYIETRNRNEIGNIWNNESQSKVGQEGATFSDIQNDVAARYNIEPKRIASGIHDFPLPEWLNPFSGGDGEGTFTAGPADPPPEPPPATPADPPPEVPPETIIGSSGDPILSGDADPILGKYGYETTPWAYIYGDYLKQTVGLRGDPSIYQHLRSEGLSNDPLQRMVYTQFLLDGTYSDSHRGALYGVPPDQIATKDSIDSRMEYIIGTGNPYADYLKAYKPFSQSKTIGLIYDVIQVLRGQSDWRAEDAETYSPAQQRNFRWEHRFFNGSNALDNQRALAALPIMKNTPVLLRQETSNILGMLYERWQADPSRDENVGWLEHVYNNKFFGLAGSTADIAYGGLTGEDYSRTAEQNVKDADTSQPGWTPKKEVVPEKEAPPEKKVVPDKKVSTNPTTQVAKEAVIPDAGPPNTQALPGQEGYNLPTIQEKIALYNEFGTPWSEFEGRLPITSGSGILPPETVPSVQDFVLKYHTSAEQEAAFQRSRQFREFSDKGTIFEDSGRSRITGWFGGSRKNPTVARDETGKVVALPLGYSMNVARDRFEDWVNE